MEEHASTVSAIEEAGKQSAADHSESDQAWLLWHRVQADLKDHDQLCHEAKVRLSRFPIFRGRRKCHLHHHTCGSFIYSTDVTREPQLTYHVVSGSGLCLLFRLLILNPSSLEWTI